MSLLSTITAATSAKDKLMRLFSTSGTAKFTTPDVMFGGEADYRAKLLVPPEYTFGEFTQGGDNYILYNNDGIVFPYTPTIAYENSASYSTTNPLHTNYTIYSYKHSAISPIKVTAKFTVQSDDDAAAYLAISHLLKSLTKMQYGTDFKAGSPPPVCRFSAYGDFMMKNIPVVVSNFSQEMSPDVDYYAVSPNVNKAYAIYGVNFVPTMSTFNITLLPVYSRNEMSQFNVTEFRDSKTLRKGGFL